MKKPWKSKIWWFIVIAWIIFIYMLSSQDGTQTAETSKGIAESIAMLIYQNPSVEQIGEIHISLRKIAHVGLFFILGMLSYFACYITLRFYKKKGEIISIVISIGIIIGYGYFDEWQKQFINGRHFQEDEAMLNIFSGLTGILFILVIRKLICSIIKMYQKK